jgi:hypothetical protein
MIRLAVARIKLFPQSQKTIFHFALLCAALLVAACSGAKQDSASNSPTSSTAPASSAASSAAGAFEGAITANLFADAQPMEMKYWIKGSRSRIETNLSRGGREMGAMLLDVSSGTQTMLIPQTKTYMTMNWGEGGLKDMVEKMGKDAEDEPLKATSIGKTETIAGYSCEHWLMGERQDTDVCLAKGLGFFGGGGQSGGIFDKLKNLAMGEKMKAQLDANPEFAKFVEGGAFPLKVSQIENGQTKTVMEVTSVERKPLDDSLFTVPPDYKKMEIPGMPGIPPGKK